MIHKNRARYLVMTLFLFCMVLIFASCNQVNTTVSDSTTTLDSTTAPDTTTALDSTTLDTTEDEYAWMKRVDLYGDPESYFSEAFKEQVGVEEDGALRVFLILQDEYRTKEDYEAFAQKYEIDGYISMVWTGEYYRAYYIMVPVHNVEELKAYAILPEVWKIDFDRKAIN